MSVCVSITWMKYLYSTLTCLKTKLSFTEFELRDLRKNLAKFVLRNFVTQFGVMVQWISARSNEVSLSLTLKTDLLSNEVNTEVWEKISQNKFCQPVRSYRPMRDEISYNRWGVFKNTDFSNCNFGLIQFKHNIQFDNTNFHNSIIRDLRIGNNVILTKCILVGTYVGEVTCSLRNKIYLYWKSFYR